MLRRITEYGGLDAGKLMDIYSESNDENTEYFFPEETDKAKAVRRVEEGFLDFLKNEFFSQDGAAVWVLEEDGAWLSALRTCKVGDDPLYYLEALETRPDEGRPLPALCLCQQKEHRFPEDPREMRLPDRIGSGI